MPCRWCTQCRIDRRYVLESRINAEVQYYEFRGRNSTFATVTYDDPHLPRDGSLKRGDAKKLMHRLRMHYRRHTDIGDYKYICVGEYGDKLGRPHYHMILIGVPLDQSFHLAREWSYGTVDLKPLLPGGIRYVIKYIDKQVHGKYAEELYGDMEQPFMLQSRGIGERYMLANLDHMLAYEYINKNGARSSIPHYYRDKLSKLSNRPLIANDQMESYVAQIALEARNAGVDPQLYILDKALSKERAYVHKSYSRLGTSPVIDGDYLLDIEERLSVRSAQLSVSADVQALAQEAVL